MATWSDRERLTDVVVPHVVAALDPPPGAKVLDIGCGLGNLSLAIADRVGPRGSVTGADISAGMTRLAEARAGAAGANNARFAVCDLQTDIPPGGPFDAAISQFGVMFFDDPVAAFANIRSLLRPAARLAFACWQPGTKNHWCPVPVVAPFGAVPPPTLAGAPPPGPFAFGDPRYVRRILASAGFTGMSRQAKRLVARAPEQAVADDSLIRALAVPPEREIAAAKALEEHVERFRQDDGLSRFELNIQIFTARNG